MPAEVQDKIIDVGTLVLKNGVLDRKTKALVALAAAVANRCVHCHGQGRQLARRLGADRAEIEEAEAIGARMQKRCENEGGLYRIN